MKINKPVYLLIACSIGYFLTGCNEAKNVATPKNSNNTYPIQAALDSMSEFTEESGSTFKITQLADLRKSKDEATVVVEEHGLQDDSISAEKTVFSMKLIKGQWEVISTVKTQSCLPGRGHQDFSNKVCQ